MSLQTVRYALSSADSLADGWTLERITPPNQRVGPPCARTIVVCQVEDGPLAVRELPQHDAVRSQASRTSYLVQVREGLPPQLAVVEDDAAEPDHLGAEAIMPGPSVACDIAQGLESG